MKLQKLKPLLVALIIAQLSPCLAKDRDGYSFMTDSINRKSLNKEVSETIKLFQGNPSEKQTKEGLAKLKTLAKKDNGIAQYFLGRVYQKGLFNTSKNFDQAIQYYKTAAENGLTAAQGLLGAMYYADKELLNPKLAESWSLKAANKGFWNSQFLLAILYLDGKKGKDEESSISQDDKKAIYWFTKAHDNDPKKCPPPYSMAASMCLDGITGVKKNKARAIKFLEEGARRKEDAAQTILGELLINGDKIEKNIDKGIEYIKQAANQNYITAIEELGEIYSTDRYVDPDYKEALKWYLKGAELKAPKCINELGLFYEKGLGVKKDKTKSFQYYKQAHELGYTLATNNVATCYVQGTGTKQDVEKGIKLLEELANSGKDKDAPSKANDRRAIKYAAYNLALYYRDGIKGLKKDPEKAFKWFEFLADRKTPVGYSNIGIMYINGEGVEVDEKKGFENILKAAKLDIPIAQYNLYYLYKNGTGVEKNNKKAFEWLEKSAKNGYVQAQRVTGILLVAGAKGFPQDYKKGFKYLQLASKNGDTFAKKQLGMCYLRGYGVDKDIDKGIAILKELADKVYVPNKNTDPTYYVRYEPGGEIKVKVDDYRADSLAACNLGDIYKSGIEVKRDYTQAFKYYKKAEKSGDSLAIATLGAFYINGWGTDIDTKKGIEYTKKAAQNGISFAQYNLAQLYKKGKIVEKSEKEYTEWLQKAADNGYSDAMYDLGEDLIFADNNFKNAKKGFYYVEKSAELGNLEAVNILAVCYAKGWGTERDIPKAISLYKKVADVPFVESKNAKKTLITHFDGKKKSVFTIDDDKPDATAAYNLAMIYKNGTGVKKDYKKAIHYLNRAIKRGHSFAIEQLGVCYLFGLGVEKDSQKGLQLIKQVADSNQAFAQYHLYKIYKYGTDGIKKDEKKALSWLQKSADNGDMDAQYKLGIHFLYGPKDKRDFEKAIAYLTKAGKKGEPFATYDLGMFYLRTGTKFSDSKKGISLLNSLIRPKFIASKKPKTGALMFRVGNTRVKVPVGDYTAEALASYALGSIYDLGNDVVEKDPAKALKYLERSAKFKNSRAQALLGYYYLSGKAGTKDLDKGFKLTKEAAEAGVPLALYNLASCYRNGIGVEKNEDEALTNYKKAAKSGYTRAEKFITELNKSKNDKGSSKEVQTR